MKKNPLFDNLVMSPVLDVLDRRPSYEPPKIKFAKMFPLSITPQQIRPGDAGFDLYAFEGKVVHDGRVTHVPTGIAVEIPEGYVGLICPRSGLAANFGITVVNAPGIIDSNYRGELIVLLTRLSLGSTSIAAGDRIAQLVVVPLCNLQSTEVDYAELSTTNRGHEGFGSSGR